MVWNLLLAVATGTGFLLILELGVRALRLNIGFFLLPSPANCMWYSPLLGMEFRPECTGDLTFTRFKTNALGLRGPDLRDDGSIRILAIGDSCTWGWGVRQEETYPMVLQQLLDQDAGQGRYQVINAGVPGYTSYQGFVYLRERGLALHPAIVIAAFGFNDPLPTGDVETQLRRARLLMPLVTLDNGLLNRSALYRWTRWRLNEAAPKDQAPRVTAEGYRRNITAIIRLARDNAVRPLVLNFWRPDAVERDYAAALAEVTLVEEVPMVTYDGPRFDVVHPTADGYRWLASRILERLEAAGYLK